MKEKASGKSFVLTCGTSLRKSLCWRGLRARIGVPDGVGLHDLSQAQRARVRDFHQRLWPAELGAASLADFSEAFDSKAWRATQLSRLSAELAAIYLLDRSFSSTNSKACFTLIHGAATPHCAMVTKSLLEHPDLVDFIAKDRPRVTLLPVEKLDSRHSADYAEGLHQLTLSLERLPQTGERIYCLAGGFKAMVGHVVARACWEQAQGRPTRAYFLGQDAKSLIQLPMSFATGQPRSA